MIPLPQAAITGFVFAMVLAVPFGLYALLTREQRREMREIRAGAAARGWRYRLRRWQGNPIAFRMDGRSAGGPVWMVTCENTSGYDRGWSGRLTVRFPTLAGETEVVQQQTTAWPSGAIRPHSVVAWQDSSGLHFQVRLPGPPNWITVEHAVVLAQALAVRGPHS